MPTCRTTTRPRSTNPSYADHLLRLHRRASRRQHQRRASGSTTRRSAAATAGPYGTGDSWFAAAVRSARSTRSTTQADQDTERRHGRRGLRHPLQARTRRPTTPSAATVPGVGTARRVRPRNPNNGDYYHLQLVAHGQRPCRRQGLPPAHRDDRPVERQRPEEHRRPQRLHASGPRPTGGRRASTAIGAMETFEPLRGGGLRVFYLAQIDKNYAGKTMEINLWDPGDTGNLSASLKVLAPDPAALHRRAASRWTSHKGTTNSERLQLQQPAVAPMGCRSRPTRAGIASSMAAG